MTSRISLLKYIKDSSGVYDESEGFKCHIVDISENGALVVVGGRVGKDYVFKVQSRISHLNIVMVARLLNTDYNKEKNLSLLRLRAIHQGVVMKNRISALVHEINLASP